MANYPKSTSAERWLQHHFAPPSPSSPPSSDQEDLALKYLLRTFPHVSLEIIASAFTKADGDPGRAAQLLACHTDHGEFPQDFLNPGTQGLSKDYLDPPANHGLSKHCLQGAERRSQAYNRSFDGISGCAQPRIGGPRHSKLADYFPSKERNAWVEPLRERMDRNLVVQEPLSSCESGKSSLNTPPGTSGTEFPILVRQEVVSGRSLSPLQSPSSSIARSSRKVSVASGTVSNARRRRNDKTLSDTKSTDEGSSPQGVDKSLGNGRKTSRSKNPQRIEVGTRDGMRLNAVEEFLFSMLGDGFELGIEAVRDVLGHYEGDVQKSLDVLLQMAVTSSSTKQNEQNAMGSTNFEAQDSDASHVQRGGQNGVSHPGFVLMEAFPEKDPNEVVRVLESCEGDVEQATNVLLEREGAMQSRNLEEQNKTRQAFEEEMLKQEHSSMRWVVDRLCKEFPFAESSTLLEVLHTTNFNYSDAEKILLEAGCKEAPMGSREKVDHAELSKVILESLFKPREEKEQDTSHDLPQNPQEETRKSAELMWKVVTASEDCTPRDDETTVQASSYGDWDDYERHHQSAKQHWQTMEHYFKAAASAYASADPTRAELLSEKGKMFKQLSVEARERANSRLFHVKNQDNENYITLDLCAQHVGEALQLLKLHLKSLAPIPSCHNLRVIMGSGVDLKSGHTKVKQAVERYLRKKEIEWIEINPGCLQITLNKVQLQA